MGGGDYCAGFGCSNSRRKPDRYRVNIFVNKASRGYILSVSFIVICAGIQYIRSVGIKALIVTDSFPAA